MALSKPRHRSPEGDELTGLPLRSAVCSRDSVVSCDCGAELVRWLEVLTSGELPRTAPQRTLAASRRVSTFGPSKHNS